MRRLALIAGIALLPGRVGWADEPPPPGPPVPTPEEKAAPPAAVEPILDEPRPPAAAAWRLLKVVEGITLRLAPSGTRAPWGSAEGIIDAPVERVLRHLTEFELLVGRVPRLAKVKVLRRIAAEALVYFYYDLPWPISNRDYTVLYRWARTDPGRVVIVVETANQNGPLPTDAVRVNLVRGKWQLSATADGKTSARYEFLGDYGGNMTKGMIEQTSWKQPLETIRSIRKVLAAPPSPPPR